VEIREKKENGNVLPNARTINGLDEDRRGKLRIRGLVNVVAN